MCVWHSSARQAQYTEGRGAGPARRWALRCSTAAVRPTAAEGNACAAQAGRLHETRTSARPRPTGSSRTVHVRPVTRSFVAWASTPITPSSTPVRMCTPAPHLMNVSAARDASQSPAPGSPDSGPQHKRRSAVRVTGAKSMWPVSCHSGGRSQFPPRDVTIRCPRSGRLHTRTARKRARLPFPVAAVKLPHPAAGRKESPDWPLPGSTGSMCLFSGYVAPVNTLHLPP
jgi:hypothetical protein